MGIVSSPFNNYIIFYHIDTEKSTLSHEVVLFFILTKNFYFSHKKMCKSRNAYRTVDNDLIIPHSTWEGGTLSSLPARANN